MRNAGSASQGFGSQVAASNGAFHRSRPTRVRPVSRTKNVRGRRLHRWPYQSWGGGESSAHFFNNMKSFNFSRFNRGKELGQFGKRKLKDFIPVHSDERS